MANAWDGLLKYLGFGASDTPTKPETAVSRPKPQPARAAKRGGGEITDIYTVETRSYADASEVAEAFRQSVPVIVNMGDMSEADARRMLDFMLGLKEGLEGHLKRVTPKVFLLSPHNVMVNSEDEGSEDDLIS